MNYLLRIAWLYPDLMSTYGDRGNVIVLSKRCEWRGIAVQLIPVMLETPVKKLKECDVLFMGGAQDRQQKLAGEDFLNRKGPVVREMVEAGVPSLFVCAAYQFVGHFYKPYQGEKIPGAGIFDLYTVHPGNQAKRLIGNIVAELMTNDAWPMLNKNVIVGFENHGGRTYLGQTMKPFAKVIRGFGNNGNDGYEGAVYKNAIGSYFHGPILTKNPEIADWLLGVALQRKYGTSTDLSYLDDSISYKAKEVIQQLRSV